MEADSGPSDEESCWQHVKCRERETFMVAISLCSELLCPIFLLLINKYSIINVEWGIVQRRGRMKTFKGKKHVFPFFFLTAEFVATSIIWTKIM